MGEEDAPSSRASAGTDFIDARCGALLESMPDGILIFDSIGHIVFANARAAHLFGYGAAELTGIHVELLVPERLRAAHRAHRSLYASDPRARSLGAGLSLCALRKDGTEFPVDVSFRAVRTGARMLVLSTVRDAAELRPPRARRLAGLSHELRTPLNAVIGFTGTLLMRLPGPLNDEQEAQLKIVQNSARHLLGVINQLLEDERS